MPPIFESDKQVIATVFPIVFSFPEKRVTIAGICAEGNLDKLKIDSMRIGQIEYLMMVNLDFQAVLNAEVFLPFYVGPDTSFSIRLSGKGQGKVWVKYHEYPLDKPTH